MKFTSDQTYIQFPVLLVQLHVDVEQVGMDEQRVLLHVDVRRNQADPEVDRKTDRCRNDDVSFQVASLCLSGDFAGVPEQVRHAALLDQVDRHFLVVDARHLVQQRDGNSKTGRMTKTNLSQGPNLNLNFLSMLVTLCLG